MAWGRSVVGLSERSNERSVAIESGKGFYYMSLPKKGVRRRVGVSYTPYTWAPTL